VGRGGSYFIILLVNILSFLFLTSMGKKYIVPFHGITYKITV
jgi:hypothetical protein